MRLVAFLAGAVTGYLYTRGLVTAAIIVGMVWFVSLILDD